ncbi:hypothetical protein KIPB_008731 [Kipferlia bialata]|uniref:Radical SAM core domain-containing protein n=1 Tax=Kipferlia bialata TaxID=797122 RepID=A0A391P4N5_9EUKA|nr:hypothetical protein KIPB_008731 [Kipferlia bialata]|eukprot:g8731.t1
MPNVTTDPTSSTDSTEPIPTGTKGVEREREREGEPETDVSLRERLVSVNYHLTKVCNYRCRFCFAHFNQIKGGMGEEGMIGIVEALAAAGTQKITFVGGEPTLVPW